MDINRWQLGSTYVYREWHRPDCLGTCAELTQLYPISHQLDEQPCCVAAYGAEAR
jgi:hypothetical protein